MIARIAAQQQLRISADDPGFVQVCLDVLASKLKPDKDGLPDPRQRALLIQLIDHFCAPGHGPAPRAAGLVGATASAPPLTVPPVAERAKQGAAA
jgi:hypothetical protein